LAIGLVVAALSTLLPAVPANAYNLFHCRFAGGGNNLKWQDSTTRASYSTIAHDAISLWNSTSTQFNFTQVTAGTNVQIADGNFGKTWMGAASSGLTLTNTGKDPLTMCGGGPWDVGLVSWFNRYYTDGYPAARRQAIMVHELGHALGLDHTTGEGCIPSIMDVDLDDPAKWTRCGRTTPKQDDINGVNSIY
jgi:hypothetical protein